MRRITGSLAAMALGVGLLIAAPAKATEGSAGLCSARAIAGEWVFHTTVGTTVPLPNAPQTEIAAVGTFNISRNGEVSGDFDANIFGAPEFTGGDGHTVVRDVPFGGPMQINSDCTGTLDLFIGGEFVRTDSFVIVSRTEIRAISLSTDELFSYQIRRIARRTKQQ